MSRDDHNDDHSEPHPWPDRRRRPDGKSGQRHVDARSLIAEAGWDEVKAELDSLYDDLADFADDSGDPSTNAPTDPAVESTVATAEPLATVVPRSERNVPAAPTPTPSPSPTPTPTPTPSPTPTSSPSPTPAPTPTSSPSPSPSPTPTPTPTPLPVDGAFASALANEPATASVAPSAFAARAAEALPRSPTAPQRPTGPVSPFAGMLGWHDDGQSVSGKIRDNMRLHWPIWLGGAMSAVSAVLVFDLFT